MVCFLGGNNRGKGAQWEVNAWYGTKRLNAVMSTLMAPSKKGGRDGTDGWLPIGSLRKLGVDVQARGRYRTRLRQP